ncbi:MAG: DUF1579 domain-containing protein [Phycisphaeraceae bacterium]|nr:DUF1579 domain-containing protein [Phycisphaeraceae bacterium]
MDLKLRHTITAGAALVGIGFFGGALVAQDHDHMGQGGDIDMEAMMQIYTELAKPDEHHAKIAQHAGKWNQTIKQWMEPGAPPEVSTGTYTITPILGGRYFDERADSTMMGMPFEGRAISGYDRIAKHYFSAWIDTWGTGILLMTGDYNEKGQLVLEGEYSDPMAPSGKSWMREVLTFVGPDKTNMEMFGKMDGQVVKMMEIQGVRAK